MTGGMIVAYVPDLMDRSRLARLGDVAYVGSPGGLAAAASGDTVIVDLSRPGVLEALPEVAATGARVLGFISHVDREGMEAARRAGCTEVLARSAFFTRLPELLEGS